jgi:outer membrane protein insertion porin family
VALNGAGISLVMGAIAATLQSAAGAVSSSDSSAGMPGAVVPTARVSVAVAVPDSTRDRWLAMANACIFLKNGAPFSPVLLNASLEALRECDRFDSVGLDSQRVDTAISLRFFCTPAPRIRSIFVIGAYPFFESDITKLLTVRPGSRCSADDAAAQQEQVAGFYRREGFPAPQVVCSITHTSRGGYRDLRIAIDHGPYLRVTAFKVEGNLHLGNPRIFLMSSTWRCSLRPGSSGRFVRATYTKGLADILARYRREGFAECRIADSVEVDSARHAVRITMRVREGPRYRIRFRGNQALKSSRLRRDLALFTEGERGGRGLDRLQSQLLERYAGRGFIGTRLEVEDSLAGEAGRQSRLLTFTVGEGRRARVKRVIFDGPRIIDGQAVFARMQTRASHLFHTTGFQADTLQRDLADATETLRDMGFEQAELSSRIRWSTDSSNVDVAIVVRPGRALTVDTVRYELGGVVTEKDAAAATALQPGTRYRRGLVAQDRDALSRRVANEGCPYVRVTSRVAIDSVNAKANIFYQVDPGRRATVRGVFFTGNYHTSRRLIRREIGLRTGEPFLLVNYLRSQNNLRELGPFNRVTMRAIGLREQADSIAVFTELDEKKPYYIDLGGGYQTVSGFFGRLTFGDRNLLGSNNHLFSAARISQTEKVADLNLSQPRLLGARTETILTLRASDEKNFNQLFGVYDLTALMGLKRKLGNAVSVLASVTFERRKQFLLAGDTTLAVNGPLALRYGWRNLMQFSPSLSLDTRDSYVRPTRGMYATLKADMAAGVQSTTENFASLQGGLSLFGHLPGGRLTGSLRGQARYIRPFGSTPALSADRLFYLGGSSTVRGYAENLLEYTLTRDSLVSVGAPLAFNANAEGHFEVLKNIEAVLFVDGGAMLVNEGGAGRMRLRASAGVGLRYVTPIGPVGFVYGWKINPRIEELRRHDTGRFHFSIGYLY